MENQISAVRWLIKKLKENGLSFLKHELEIIEQAENMFAEQIMKANADGVDSILEGTTPIGEKEYYENNFNNQ